MTANAAFEPEFQFETAAERGMPRAPWPVITTFYLWWVLILAQAVGLAYIGFTLALAAEIGGPAWDILFVDVPIGLPTLVLVALEVIFVIRMRRRSRAARIWLAVLALPAAASVIVIVSPIVSASLLASDSVEFTNAAIAQTYQLALWTIVAAALILALAAAILPFTRPVGHFFWKAPSPEPDMPGSPEMTDRR